MPQFIEADVIQKIATAAEWGTLLGTKIPYKGQIMLVSDSTGKVINIKVGDGTNNFASLEYMFDTIQANVNYVQVSGNALPTPTITSGFSVVGEGTYTRTGQANVVVPAGSLGILSWDGTVWSLSQSVDLPSTAVTNAFGESKTEASSQKLVTEVNNKITPFIFNKYDEGNRTIAAIDWVAGESISGSTGAINPNAAASRLPFIFLRKGESITVSFRTSNATGVTVNNLFLFGIDNEYKGFIFSKPSTGAGTKMTAEYTALEDCFVTANTINTYVNDYEAILTLLGGKIYLNSDDEQSIRDEIGSIYQSGKTPVTPSFLTGYYSTSSTKLTDPLTTSGVGVFSTEAVPVSAGDIVSIEGVNPFAASTGKIVNEDGDFIKNLTQSDFILNDGQYQYVVEGIEGVDRIVITCYKNNVTALLVGKSNIKSILLDATVISKKALDKGLVSKSGLSVEQIKLLKSTASLLHDNTRESLYRKGGLAYVSDNIIDTFLILGQSNMDGRAAISGAPSWLTSNNNKLDNFMMFNRLTSKFQSYQLGVNTGADDNTDTRHAFDLYIAKNFIDSRSKPLYAIKCTLGGTSIDPSYTAPAGYWTTSYETLASGKRKLLLESAARLRSAMEEANKLGLVLNIKAVIWHQGESDNGTTTAANNYNVNMQNVIAYVRGMSMNPELPFIMGTIPNASTSFNSTIRSAQESIALNDEFVELVRLDDLTLFDGLHLNGSQAQIAGNRYWTVLQNYI